MGPKDDGQRRRQDDARHLVTGPTRTQNTRRGTRITGSLFFDFPSRAGLASPALPVWAGNLLTYCPEPRPWFPLPLGEVAGVLK